MRALRSFERFLSLFISKTQCEQHLCLAVVPSTRPPNLASENHIWEIELFLSMWLCAESLFTMIRSSPKGLKGVALLLSSLWSNCRARPCNHTFVADSFEKRDDFCIARKLSDECFHLIRHERGSSSTGFRYSSWNSSACLSIFQTNRIIGGPTGAAARLGYNSSLPGEKTGHCSSDLSRHFDTLPISRHAFFVTLVRTWRKEVEISNISAAYYYTHALDCIPNRPTSCLSDPAKTGTVSVQG